MALTVDEIDAKEAASLGVSIEEYRDAKAILANTPQINAGKPIDPAPPALVSASKPEQSAIAALPTYGNQMRAALLIDGKPSNYIGVIPGTPYEVVLASRVHPIYGLGDIPIVIQRLANGTSRELSADEVKAVMGGAA